MRAGGRTDSWNTAIKLPSNVPFPIRYTIHRAADNSAMERDVRVVGINEAGFENVDSLLTLL